MRRAISDPVLPKPGLVRRINSSKKAAAYYHDAADTQEGVDAGGMPVVVMGSILTGVERL